MIKEKIQVDLKNSILNKTNTKDTLRLLLAAIQIGEKEQGKELADVEVENILVREVKKRQDSVDTYRKVNRFDLAEIEKEESDLIRTYLPEQASREEVYTIIRKAIEVTGATTLKDMGKVMKFVTSNLGNRVDNKVASEIVRTFLSQ